MAPIHSNPSSRLYVVGIFSDGTKSDADFRAFLHYD
jgi:hypothetical protein